MTTLFNIVDVFKKNCEEKRTVIKLDLKRDKKLQVHAEEYYMILNHVAGFFI